MSYNPALDVLRFRGLTAAGSGVLPTGAKILGIFVANNTANAITGGLKFGTTSGATDIVIALAVAGNFIGKVADAALLKSFFSKSATQTVFVDAVVAWNSANVDIDIIYAL